MTRDNKIEHSDLVIEGVGAINIIVGRNGSGKSRMLRRLAEILRTDNSVKLSYISPERAGNFEYNANTESNMRNDPDYLRHYREKNQAASFKQEAAIRLRSMEIAFLRKFESDTELQARKINFSTKFLNPINKILINSYISRSENSGDFIFKSYEEEEINPSDLSSGESEAITLATEIMFHFFNIDPKKNNILILDEPDVHLHPDMQLRLSNLLIDEIENHSSHIDNVTIFIATHSTAMISALCRSEHAGIGVKNFNRNSLIITPASKELVKMGTFFAHPLSKIITDDPILIIEGEDDERIWQQASRSSNGRVRLFPCLADTVSEQTQLENFSATMLTSIYDTPIGYSLRDGDGKLEPLAPIGPIQRFRLNCYAMENLLLTDEVLNSMDTTWGDFQTKAQTWVEENILHKDAELLSSVIKAQDRGQHVKIKSLRNLICGILGKNKPWEVVIGQTIGMLPPLPDGQKPNEYSIRSYIGVNFLAAINI